MPEESMSTRTVHRYPFGNPDRLILHPRYAWLREHEPVARVRLPHGEESWLVTRYADVRTVLADPRFSRAAAAVRDVPRVSPSKNDGGGLLFMDPPDHTRLRRLVAKAFTARRVEELRPRVAVIAGELVNGVEATGAPIDLVEAFALPMPVTVICELLGVPVADRDRFRVWSDAIISTTALPPATIQEYRANLHAYMAGLVAERRREPTDADLLGALVKARDDSDKLSEQELIGLSVGLLIAGHETIATQIPNFTYALLTHPEQREQLRQRPDLMPAAVEELLRWVPLGAASAFPRYAIEDVTMSDGTVVRAGDPVLASVAAANRDPDVFADPDRIDFTRERIPHVGFGHGVHHCVGAPLARMELQVGLATLLSRLPALRPAVPEPEIPWKAGLIVRGPKRLPVAW